MHQGADWAPGSESWLGTKWGSNAEKQYVKYDFDVVKAWAKENQRPMFLGEFSAHSKGNMASRAHWTDFVAHQAEERNFSWGYWEFCAGFGSYDPTSNQWHEELVQALIPSRRCARSIFLVETYPLLGLYKQANKKWMSHQLS